jgi:hypothetical protein
MLNAFIISDVKRENKFTMPVRRIGKKKIIGVGYNYNNKKVPLIFQTPYLFSIKNPKLKKVCGVQYYELDVPIMSKNDTKTKMFKKFMDENDEWAIEEARKNKLNWLGTSETSKQHKIKFHSSILSSSEKNKFLENGLIRLRIYDTGSFVTKIIDEEGGQLAPTDLYKCCFLRCLIELTAILIDENNIMTLLYRPYKIQLSVGSPLIDDYSFVEDPDDIDDTTEIQDTETEASVACVPKDVCKSIIKQIDLDDTPKLPDDSNINIPQIKKELANNLDTTIENKTVLFNKPTETEKLDINNNPCPVSK